MLQLASLIAQLPTRPAVEELIGEFVPPARFAEKRFANYQPARPSQERARDRLSELALELQRSADVGVLHRLLGRWRSPHAGSGVYLDGGFGVGKTHLLAALWHEAPFPKTYLSFDELVYFIGLVGVDGARAAFAGQRLAAVDEWELDDPGNLKLALAFLRGALQDGLRIVVSSNTLPLDLGHGRFNQKDFRAEIEELAEAFEVLSIEGEDYRRRRFAADPRKRYFLSTEALHCQARIAGERALLVAFPDLLAGLATVHPIRYAGLVDRIGALFVEDVAPVTSLVDAIRWVHFIDTLYDSAVPLRASGDLALGALFPIELMAGPYRKKLSRCLSRMEEMLGE